jgi:RNA polymerase sigma factor (sigma-70 family)
MTTNEQAILAKHDPQAMDALMVTCEGLCRSFVQRIASARVRRLYYDDAMQAARLAIFRAVAIYDPARGSFSTCAFYQMQAAMRLLKEDTNLVRVPYRATSADSFDRAMQEPVDITEAEVGADGRPDPSEEAAISDDLARMRDVIAGLPKAQREAIEWWQGKENKTITKQAWNLRFRAALEKLRDALGGKKTTGQNPRRKAI